VEVSHTDNGVTEPHCWKLNCLSQLKFLTASIPMVPSWPDYHYGKYIEHGIEVACLGSVGVMRSQ